MKGDKNTEIGVVWGLGVTQGHQQYNHSLKVVLKDVSVARQWQSVNQ